MKRDFYDVEQHRIVKSQTGPVMSGSVRGLKFTVLGWLLGYIFVTIFGFIWLTAEGVDPEWTRVLGLIISLVFLGSSVKFIRLLLNKGAVVCHKCGWAYFINDPITNCPYCSATNESSL